MLSAGRSQWDSVPRPGDSVPGPEPHRLDALPPRKRRPPVRERSNRPTLDFRRLIVLTADCVVFASRIRDRGRRRRP
jgi:hypothetical protein